MCTCLIFTLWNQHCTNTVSTLYYCITVSDCIISALYPALYLLYNTVSHCIQHCTRGSTWCQHIYCITHCITTVSLYHCITTVSPLYHHCIVIHYIYCSAGALLPARCPLSHLRFASPRPGLATAHMTQAHSAASARHTAALLSLQLRRRLLSKCHAWFRPS